jgi:2-phosphoglycerate kinase
VLLIGGASGVGKTSVSYRLASHFGVGITPVDDFQAVAEAITTPDQLPALHLFGRDPDAFFRMSPAEKLQHAIACSEEMATVLEPVIANHLSGEPPIVLDGDFIHPRLIPPPGSSIRVRGFVIYDDETQIAANYLAREGEDQGDRATNSFRHSEWLRAECLRRGIPALPARPWDTLLERAITSIAR